MLKALFQKLMSVMGSNQVLQPEPSSSEREDSESNQTTEVNNPHQAKDCQTSVRPESAQAVECCDATEIDSENVSTMNGLSQKPLSIANYQDLLLVLTDKPKLNRFSEYPPQPRSIEAVTIDEIMAYFADAIRQSADDLPMDRDEIDAYFLPIVRRGLMYMHLLPASQYHHHNGVGGLFAHSLQVSALAVRLGKQKVFNQRDTPRELYQNGKRWLFACWLTGFLHDIGKPVTDVTVTSNGETWYPYTSSLIAWLQDNNIREYHFIWKSAGHNRHQQSTLMFVKDIVPPQTFVWLAEYGARTIWETCESALIHANTTGNLIAEIVQQADEITSGEDIKDRNEGKIDPRRLGGSLPAAEYIIDALHLLVAENAIRVNERGSILHVTTSGTFVIWTSKASELIYTRVLEEKHTSVPRKMDRMLECLVTAGMVEPVPAAVNPVGGYFWPVVFDFYPEQPFKSIKLRSTHVLFNGLIPPDPSLAIVNGWEEQNPAVIAEWEKKHGKLVAENVKEEIPETNALPVELPTETDPDAVAGEASYFGETQKDTAPECGSTASESNHQGLSDESFKAQLKSILCGGEAIQSPQMPTQHFQDERKPTKQAQEIVRARLAQGDLSFLAPGNSQTTNTTPQPVISEASAIPKMPAVPSCLHETQDRFQKDASVINDANAKQKAQPSTSSMMDILMGQSSKDEEGPDSPTESIGPSTASVSEPFSETPVNTQPTVDDDLGTNEAATTALPSSPSGEEKTNEQGVETTVDPACLYPDAALSETPYLALPMERISTFASRSEALKHEKRMQTIDSQKEQSLVTLVKPDGNCMADVNKASVKMLASGNDSATAVSNVNSEASHEEDSQQLPLNKRLSLLRSEIIQGLLAGTSSLFPLGLLSVTDSERRADASQLFVRALELGLEAEKVRALTTGFQPGDRSLGLEGIDKRTVVVLKRKA